MYMVKIFFQGSSSSWSGVNANGSKKNAEDGDMVSTENLYRIIAMRVYTISQPKKEKKMVRGGCASFQV